MPGRVGEGERQRDSPHKMLLQFNASLTRVTREAKEKDTEGEFPVTVFRRHQSKKDLVKN